MARFEKDGKVFEITSADARYTTELRKHLRDGWLRVADLRCEDPLGAEPIEPQLEAALRAEPHDIGAALVYADWLQQRGHPRGALIAVQHRLAIDPRDAELIEAERKIIEEAGESLVSRSLVAHLSILRGTIETALSRNLFEGGALAFDHGFIRKARVSLRQRGGDEDLLWELLRHPSARVLAELNVTVDHTRDIPLVAALLVHGSGHGPRPPLRALKFRVEHRGSTVDLAGLDAAFPQLEDLEIAIHNVRFGELAMPLRRLSLRGAYADLARILADRTWPALERLELSGDLDGYRPAFEHDGFPALRRLVMHGSENVADRAREGLFLCRMLVRSPAAARLERLELPGVLLADEAVTLLVERRAVFARLAALEIETYGRQATIERLRAAGYPI